MKTILIAINARYTHSSLALRYLRSFNPNHDISFAEFTINDSLDSMLAALLAMEGNLYCFSCYIWNIEHTLKLAERVKKAIPQAFVAFGGPEVSYCPDKILSCNPFVDAVMIGEGEETLGELVDALESGEECPAIAGLAVRGKCVVRRTPLDLGRIPMPYTREDIRQLKDRMIYFETSRGCPFHCSYCLSSAEGAVRWFPMDYVKKGLGMLLEEEVPLIKLIDRSFNCNPGRAEEILRFVLEHTRCSCVHMELEPQLLTEKLIRLLAAAPAGTFQVEIGIQTANPDTLAAVRRTPLSPEAETRVKQLTELPGVHVHLDLIAGLPMEGYRSFAHSFDYVYNMKPDMLQLGFLKVLHGTAMEEQEEITASSFPPYEVVGTRWITPQELCRLKRVEEAVEQFYNSGGFRETLAVLQPSAPFQLFEELGDLLYHAQQEGRLKRRELYGLLFDYLGEEFRKPLSLDFLKHNQSIPLPEFTRPQRERGFKDQMYRLMKQPKFCKKYGVEPDLRRLRFERMDGTAYMVDYATGRLFVLEEVPVLYEKWMQL